MSVIQQIRDKYAAVVIAVIALSLIGFILMDAFVGRGSGMGSTSTVVGKVNGEKIDRNDFERRITMAQAMYGPQAKREQLIGNVWDQTVEEIVLNQEYESLGLKFTDKELNEMLFSANSPEWLKSQFTDQATGEFKANEAKQALAQLKKSPNNPTAENVAQAIQATRVNALRTKYMALLTQSTYVPKWLAEKSVTDQNTIASFSYVTVPYSSIVDTTIKVSDDEVKAYVNKHPEMFKQEEASRSISYVTFDAMANRDDSAAVLNNIRTLGTEFAATSDNEGFINRVGSELQFLNAYSLGSKIQLENPEHTAAIKALENGQIYGPYLDGNNYVLAKMVDRRMMPDSVKVRHILIKTGDQGNQTLSDTIARARIDSIAGAIRNGADFNAMVLQFSNDDGSKATRGEYDFSSTQFANLSKEFAEVAFYGKTGDKKVVKVENASYSGYHYIEVINQKGIEQAYKVAYLAKPIDASQTTINAANSQASQFAATSRNKKQFEENAAKQGLPVMNMMDVKTNDYNVAGMGENRAFVRWVYENKTGDVSEPFEVNNKFIVGVITSTSDKGLMNVARARPSAEPFIINEKKALQIINTKFKGGATIEAVAQGAGQPVLRADSINFAQPFAQQIGNEAKVIGAGFNKSLQGKISEPIAGNTGVFVVKGESITAQANTSVSVEDIRRQMEMQQKQMSGYRSMEALKKAADVSDNRFDFY